MGMRSLSLTVLCAGCLSTSSYQTARMLPVGATRVSAAVNSYEGHYTDTNNSGSHGEDAFEVMASQGVADNVELGGKIAWINAEANIFHLLAVPKVSLIPNQLAVVVPTGASFIGAADIDGDGMNDSESGHYFETLPGIVGSYILSPYFELTGATQLIWLINEDFDDSEFYGGANIGVRLSPPGAAWAVQPEIGIAIPITSRDNNNVDYFLQYGFAFHYQFGGVAAGATDPAAGTMPVAPAP